MFYSIYPYHYLCDFKILIFLVAILLAHNNLYCGFLLSLLILWHLRAYTYYILSKLLQMCLLFPSHLCNEPLYFYLCLNTHLQLSWLNFCNLIILSTPYYLWLRFSKWIILFFCIKSINLVFSILSFNLIREGKQAHPFYNGFLYDPNLLTNFFSIFLSMHFIEFSLEQRLLLTFLAKHLI